MGIESELLDGELHQENDSLDVSGIRETNLEPLRILGSVRVNLRITRMNQALAFERFSDRDTKVMRASRSVPRRARVPAMM